MVITSIILVDSDTDKQGVVFFLMALSVVEERRSTVSCHKTAYGHSRIVLLIVQLIEPTISAHSANRYLL